MLLQTQDAGGPRGRFAFNAVGHRARRRETGIAERHRELVRVVPARLAEHRAARPEGHRRAGHEALGDRRRSSRTSGRRGRTSPSTSACAGSTTRRSRASRARARWRTTTRRPTRCASPGYGSTTNAAQREELLQELRRRARACPGVSTRRRVVRAGYGASAIPFPDNRYAFNFPVKQNYSGTAANGFQRAGIDGGRLPGAGRSSNIPADGIIPVDRVAAQLDLRRHPAGPARGHAALLERRVPAPAAATASPPTSPTSATAASIS